LFTPGRQRTLASEQFAEARAMPATQSNTTPEGAIWGRLLDPAKPTLSAEAARAVLVLDFPPADKERMNELAARARAGTIAPEEMEEVETYGRVGSVLGIMKSKARRALKAAPRTNGQRN
jgi:hypothetical protein